MLFYGSAVFEKINKKRLCERETKELLFLVVNALISLLIVS